MHYDYYKFSGDDCFDIAISEQQRLLSEYSNNVNVDVKCIKYYANDRLYSILISRLLIKL